MQHKYDTVMIINEKQGEAEIWVIIDVIFNLAKRNDTSGS